MELGVSYFGNRMAKYVAKDMEELKKMGCSFVVHTFSEDDFNFYRHTMQEIAQASRDAGLQVWFDPWGVGKVFGGEAFSHFLLEHPESWQIASDGKPVGTACPNRKDFRNFMKDWIDAAVEAEGEVIFWDEPHFYLSDWMGGRAGTWGCRCPVCVEKFAERYGTPLPKEQTKEFLEFKAHCILEFLEEMIVYVHSLGKKNALCLLPMEDETLWKRVVDLKGLNVLGTDPYWYGKKMPVDEYVPQWSKTVAEACHDRHLEGQIWIQGFKVPRGREPEILEAMRFATDAGIRNIAVWGFGACGHMTRIRPDDAQKTWGTITQGFKELRERYG